MDAIPAVVSSTSAEEEGFSPGPFTLLLLLVAAVLWSGHALHKSRFAAFITEGSLALIWGLLAGGAFYVYYEDFMGIHIPTTLVAFNYDIFMCLLLPPIIFYAGFSIKKKDFFANFDALATLGVLATVITSSILATAMAWGLHAVQLDSHSIVGNALALGVVFAPTDSVAALQALGKNASPQLHALVFGESVVNDATAIVLLRAVQNIHTEAQLTASTVGAILTTSAQLAFLSMLWGSAVGLMSSFILRISFQRRHSTDHEVSLLLAHGFLSYLSAEWVGFSGVFSTFFCGITMSHYSWHNLSPSAKVSSVYLFRVLSFLAELVMLLSCGLDIWSSQLWHTDAHTKQKMWNQIIAFAGIITVSVTVVRFAITLPFVSLINSWRLPDQRISWQNTMALAWSGCVRGALTLALAVNHFLGGGGGEVGDENRTIAAAAMIAIFFSTIVLGGATPPIFKYLRVLNIGRDGGGGGGGDAKNNRGHHSSTTTPTPPPPSSSSSLPSIRTAMYDNRAAAAAAAAAASGINGGGHSSLHAPLLGGAARMGTVTTTAAAPDDGPQIKNTLGGSGGGGVSVRGTVTDPSSPSRHRRPIPATIDEENEEVGGGGDDNNNNNISSSTLHSKWINIDRNYLQPLFGGRTHSTFSSFSRGSPPSPGRSQDVTAAYRAFQRSQQSAPGHTTGSGSLGGGDEMIVGAAPAAAAPAAAGGSGCGGGGGGLHPSPFGSSIRRGSSDIEAARPAHHEDGGGAGGGDDTEYEQKDLLEELFVYAPGFGNREENVDQEIENEGLVEQAENNMGSRRRD